MKRLTRLTLLAGLLLAVPAVAAGQERGKPKDRGTPATEPAGSRVLTDLEIRLIRNYYATSTWRPKPLPPGIAKNLSRGKPLPPGIAKTRLPKELLVTLPPRPGFEIVLLGERVALLDKAGILLDVRIGIFL